MTTSGTGGVKSIEDASAGDHCVRLWPLHAVPDGGSIPIFTAQRLQYGAALRSARVMECHDCTGCVHRLVKSRRKKERPLQGPTNEDKASKANRSASGGSPRTQYPIAIIIPQSIARYKGRRRRHRRGQPTERGLDVRNRYSPANFHCGPNESTLLRDHI